MKEKLLNLISIIKRRKYLVLSIVLVIIVIIIYYTFSNNTNEKTATLIPANTPIPANAVHVEPKRQDSSISFLFNRFDSLTGLIGYTWDGNKIVYATKNGIYKLWKNEPIISAAISYIDFNSGGQGIYSDSSNNYFLFSSADNSTRKIGSNLGNAKVDSKGAYILYQSTNSLYLMPLIGNSVLKLQVGPNISFGWIEDKESFYIVNKNTNEFNSYDLDTKIIGTASIKNGSRFLSVSPDGNKVVSYSGGTVSINDINDKSSTLVQFDQGSTFYTYWINPTEFILVQTLERSNLGLFDDYIWKIDINGGKLFLANSFPIPNKLNLNTKVFIDQNKDTLIFSENKGKIWVLSLIPSKISTYTEQGVSFFGLPSNSRED